MSLSYMMGQMYVKAERKNTINENLQRAIEAIQKQPSQHQAVIADKLLDDLSEREWNEIVSKPHVQKRFRELANEEGGFGE